jgi:hypothetical protein
MTERHFKLLWPGSLFGSPVCERVVPLDHFLARLDRLIDWDSFREIWSPCTRSGKGGATVLSARRDSRDVGDRIPATLSAR